MTIPDADSTTPCSKRGLPKGINFFETETNIQYRQPEIVFELQKEITLPERGRIIYLGSHIQSFIPWFRSRQCCVTHHRVNSNGSVVLHNGNSTHFLSHQSDEPADMFICDRCLGRISRRKGEYLYKESLRKMRTMGHQVLILSAPKHAKLLRHQYTGEKQTTSRATTASKTTLPHLPFLQQWGILLKQGYLTWYAKNCTTSKVGEQMWQPGPTCTTTPFSLFLGK